MIDESKTIHEDFFTDEEAGHLIEVIQKAELGTSGEIRVHLEDHCAGEVKARSRQVFEELNMNQTQHGNGVLIYVAVKDRTFSVFADQGITAKVLPTFWDSLINKMREQFSKGLYLQGMRECIEQIGKALQQHFPSNPDGTVNELPDTLSFGNDLESE